MDRMHLKEDEKQLLERVLLEQPGLLTLAKSKFPDPSVWLWTRTLLEQASDFWCAEESALDFPRGSEVFDVCCGAGADSLALARHGCNVIAVDQSPLACLLMRNNSHLQRLDVPVIESAAESVSLKSGAYLHIDPDRRSTGYRTTGVSGFAPSWAWIDAARKQSTGVSIKVAPATQDRELTDSPEVIRFLSRDRSVRQQRWLWGLKRWPTGSIVLSVWNRTQWAHEIFSLTDRLSPETDLGSSQILSYVADYDPVIRAACLANAFRLRVACEWLDPRDGYLTSDQIKPHPMLRWFRVVDVLPLDTKRMKAYARQCQCKQWELKSRAVKIDLQKLQTQLAVDKSSNTQRTILFGRVDGRPRAVVAESLGGWGDSYGVTL